MKINLSQKKQVYFVMALVAVGLWMPVTGHEPLCEYLLRLVISLI